MACAELSPSYGIQACRRRTWNGELSLTLQEGSVGLDELVGLQETYKISEILNEQRGGVVVAKECAIQRRIKVKLTSTSRTLTPGMIAVLTGYTKPWW